MKKLKLRIIGLLLAPILYLRWSVMLIAVVLVMIVLAENLTLDKVIMPTLCIWALWSIVVGFIYANCEALGPIVKWFISILKVQYRKVDSKSHSYTGMYSKTVYRTYIINGIAYEFGGSEVGGYYEASASINRNILFTYLFNA